MYVSELRADPLLAKVRGHIVDEIGKRCGQIPDIHPRLLEGIESAARLIREMFPEGLHDVTVLRHHVVFKDGQDIVCACGEHFRSTQIFGVGESAVTQWVRHYRETKP